MSDLRDLLLRTAGHIADYRETVADHPVAPAVVPDELRAALGGALPDKGDAPATVINDLMTAVAPALVASTGPRYFGFVVGGAVDSATCADLLATGWDQPAFNAITAPAAAIAEEVAGGWLKELIGLPAGASFGFVTGGQGANTVGLAAARHHVLANAGWDVEELGVLGAPAIRVVASEERHATIDRSLRLLGLGTRAVHAVAADANGATDIDALTREFDDGDDGPTIVCLQAGNVNTGACDDIGSASEAS